MSHKLLVWLARLRTSPTLLSFEIAAVFASIMTYIWLFAKSAPWLALFPISLIIFSWCWRRNTYLWLTGKTLPDWYAEEFGFLPKSTKGLGKLTLIWLAAMVTIVVLGLIFNPNFLKEKQLWSLTSYWLSRYFVWGWFQQFVLHGYVTRNLKTVLRNDTKTAFWTSVIFSFLHLPNPLLMVITFFSAFVSAKFFLKYSNIYILALFHGFLAVAIGTCLPDSLVQNLRIGPRFLEKLTW